MNSGALTNLARRAAKSALRTMRRPVTKQDALPVVNKFKPEEHDRFNWLRNAGIKTVLDIGANTGQFATHIHTILPTAQIYSFEPLAECYRQLSANLIAPSFKAFPIGLSAENGHAIINRNAFSPSSSLLPLGRAHKENFPFATETHAETIELRRLDDVAKELEIRDNLLIKIDVQGFEDRVIQGGQKTIQRAGLLIVEVSFERLYEGQPLFSDIYDFLRRLGFVYHGAMDQLLSPSDGRTLQADGIFTKDPATQ